MYFLRVEVPTMYHFHAIRLVLREIRRVFALRRRNGKQWETTFLTLTAGNACSNLLAVFGINSILKMLQLYDITEAQKLFGISDNDCLE